MTVPIFDACSRCGRTVIESGPVYRVEAAIGRNGRVEVLEWLTAVDVLSPAGRRRREMEIDDLAVRLMTYCDTGELEIPRELNELQQGLREFKAGTVRAVFYDTTCSGLPTARITHVFEKKSQKTPRPEITKGLGIMREDQAR